MVQSLPVELEEFIELEISSGKFRTREEVIVEALRQFQERERKLDLLREDVQEVIDQLAERRGISSDEVFAGLLEQLKRQD